MGKDGEIRVKCKKARKKIRKEAGILLTIQTRCTCFIRVKREGEKEDDFLLEGRRWEMKTPPWESVFKTKSFSTESERPEGREHNPNFGRECSKKDRYTK